MVQRNGLEVHTANIPVGFDGMGGLGPNRFSIYFFECPPKFTRISWVEIPFPADSDIEHVANELARLEASFPLNDNNTIVKALLGHLNRPELAVITQGRDCKRWIGERPDHLILGFSPFYRDTDWRIIKKPITFIGIVEVSQLDE